MNLNNLNNKHKIINFLGNENLLFSYSKLNKRGYGLQTLLLNSRGEQFQV